MTELIPCVLSATHHTILMKATTHHMPMMKGIMLEGLSRALGDPIRVRILARLLEGPATVADLVAHTDSTQPNVSNHLAVLRNQGLVRGERTGRQVRYRLGSAPVAQLVEAIDAIVGAGDRPSPHSALAEARTCYDHLAGRLGVMVLEALVREGAIGRPRRDGVIDLGPRAAEVFGRLAIDFAGAAKARRRFGFACLDWTEHRAHLGGALGAALAGRFIEAEWLQRQPETRALLLTSVGRRGLRRALGISP
jgi:DNA-binding transcriptional ArsR family regulator